MKARAISYLKSPKRKTVIIKPGDHVEVVSKVVSDMVVVKVKGHKTPVRCPMAILRMENVAVVDDDSRFNAATPLSHLMVRIMKHFYEYPPGNASISTPIPLNARDMLNIMRLAKRDTTEKFKLPPEAWE